MDVETSTNFTLGLTYKLADNISATIDYYNVSVDDRVLLSTQVSTGALPEGNDVRSALETDGVESFAFFTNAADTKTQGIDFVLNFQNLISSSNNSLGLTFAFNWNDTEVDTDNLTIPAVFSDNNIDIFGREEVGRLESARPNLKGTVGLNGKFGNFRANLNNTYFGEVTETHPSDPALDQDFSAKIITDLILGYDINDKVNINLTVNNLLNVFPDELEGGDIDNNIDLGGRFRYPWHVNQFGFMGGLAKIGATFKF